MKHQYSDADKQSILKSLTVLCDSREQVNHHVTEALAALKCPTQIGKLEQGDYTGLIPIRAFGGRFSDVDGYSSLADEVIIERKANLDEIAENFTVDRRRFESEFLRAKANGIKVFLVIENSSWTDIWSHNYRSRLSPKALAGSLMSWQVKYNLTILFCRPQETGRLIYGTLYYWLKNPLDAS